MGSMYLHLSPTLESSESKNPKKDQSTLPPSIISSCNTQPIITSVPYILVPLIPPSEGTIRSREGSVSKNKREISEQLG